MRITILLSLIALTATAQTDTTKLWKSGGTIGLNFSQVALHNWVGGGQNSISANGLFNGFINYKKGKTTWDNTLDLGYGLSKIGDESNFIKNDDKIDAASKFGHYAFGDHWYYSALLNFKSQFTDGYNYPNDSVKISDFLAPGYAIMAIGLDYKRDNFSALIAPITGKVTFVNEQALANAGAYGVDKAEFDATGNVTRKGDNMRSEFGGYIKISYKKDFKQNVGFQTKLELFSNYLNNPQNIDVNWENILTLKVNKWLTTNVTFTLVYDDDIQIPVDNNNDGLTDAIGPRVQYKEVLGVGLSYKF